LRRLAAAVGIGTVFLANLDASAFTLAVPLLHRAFPAAPAGQLSLVQTGYGIGFAALILPAGQLTDRRGPRWPLLAGLAVFSIASLAGAAAPAIVMLTTALLVPAAREQAATPARERRTVLRMPGVPLATLASAVVGAGVYALQIMTGFALVDGARLSVLRAGLLLAPASLLAAAAALRVGRLRGSRVTGIACAGGGALLLAGTAAAVLAGRVAPLAGAVAGAALGVVGLGVAASCVSTAAVLAAGPAVGRVTSVSQVSRQAGGAAGAAITGAAIGGVLSRGALDSGWAVLAVAAILIVVLGRALTRPPGRMSS
jgi:predicted MFS family arabinose efflux permease